MRRIAVLVLVPMLVLIGCGDDDRRPGGDSGVDSGMGDGGGMDGGDMDAGDVDAGDVDAGDMDAGDVDAGDMDAGDMDAGMTPSEQIAAVRAAAPGPVDLEVAMVLVTYVKPEVGTEPAGFFVQAEMTGPALYVAVDPATLTPAPMVGDAVSFRVTNVADSSGQWRATVIADWMVLSSGNDVTALVQDLSAATDIVSALGSYESELVTVTGTIAADFTAAGTGHVAANIDTAGVMASSDLRLRVPTTVQSTLGLELGCTFTATAPLWRFNAVAQVSAWVDADLTAVTCAAPGVIGAVATSATEVVVTFSRDLDAASVMADGSQFTFDMGLTASAASVTSARQVTLTTSAQTAGTTYTVTVASTVTDVLGTGVDAAMNTAMFAGYTPPPPSVIINEVDYDNVGTDTAEYVELHNPGGSEMALDGLAVVFVNGGTTMATWDYRTIALTGSLPAGGYLVIASSTVTVAPGAIVINFPGATDQIQNGAPDGLAIIDTTTGAVLDALSYEGSITAAPITGVTGTVNLVEGTATTVADNNADPVSLSRLPNGVDTNNAAMDWALGTPTPGAANAAAP